MALRGPPLWGALAKSSSGAGRLVGSAINCRCGVLRGRLARRPATDSSLTEGLARGWCGKKKAGGGGMWRGQQAGLAGAVASYRTPNVPGGFQVALGDP
jgi:hypothetical protein